MSKLDIEKAPGLNTKQKKELLTQLKRLKDNLNNIFIQSRLIISEANMLSHKIFYYPDYFNTGIETDRRRLRRFYKIPLIIVRKDINSYMELKTTIKNSGGNVLENKELRSKAKRIMNKLEDLELQKEEIDYLSEKYNKTAQRIKNYKEQLSEDNELQDIEAVFESPIDEIVDNSNKIKNIQEQIANVRNKLIEIYLFLVEEIAKKNTDRGLLFCDLVQEGRLGLVEAIEKFNFHEGNSFTHYVKKKVQQFIDIAVEKQKELIKGDLVENNGIKDTAEIVEDKLIKEKIFKVLETIPIREQEVLKMHFGLEGGYPPLTLEEIASYFNVTRERIRQMESKALRRLRHPKRSCILRDLID